MMAKLFKRLLKILLGLIIVVILITIGIVNFVNPSQFKGAIEQAALKHTGQVLTIQGPLSWRWFPLLSLELENVALDNPAPFRNPMLSVKTIRAECAIWPLFFGKIFLNLTLKDLDLILERTQKKEANWEVLTHRLSTSNSNSKKSTEIVNIKPIKEKAVPPTRVLLNGINIENGQITFHDTPANKHYKLTHVNLVADSILSGAIGLANPISLSFQAENLNKPTLGNLGTFTGKCSVTFSKNHLDIQKVTLKFESPNGKIALLNGGAEIQNINQNPTVHGNIEAQDFDVKSWLQSFDIANNSSLPTSVDIKSTFQYQDQKLNIDSFNVDAKNNGILSGNLTVDRFDQPLNLRGKLFGKDLQLGKIKIDEIKATIAAKDNLINISPIDFQIIKSQQNATLKIDLRGKKPIYTLTQKGQGFEISHLLALFDIKNKLEGQTFVNLNLTTTGSNGDEWRHNLSGHSNIEISNGKLHGIDLINLLKNAQSSVETLVQSITKKLTTPLDAVLNTEMGKWKMSSSPEIFTPFNTAKGTVTITNGILKNPDLSIIHPDYAANGEGTFNLANNTIHYRASLLLKNNPSPATGKFKNFLANTPLLVTIEGNISDPSIRPDMKNYLNKAVQSAQKAVVEDLIHKTVDKAVDKALQQLRIPGL